MIPRPLAALGTGAAAGVLGVFLHNAISPFGLILALAESAISIWLVGYLWFSRFLKFLATISWSAVVLLAASNGVSFEILVYGNQNGNLFLIGGFLSVVVAFLVKPS